MTAAHKKELLKICSTPIDRAIIPIICSALFKAICDAQDQLVPLANVGSVKATHTLFFTSYKGANDLLKLFRSKPNLVKHVAQTEAYWPVNYSPTATHKTDRNLLSECSTVQKLGPANVFALINASTALRAGIFPR